VHYLLNIRLIPRRYWFRANTRVGRWQVNCEACGWCHCLRINWRRFRMWGHITSFIADGRWRFSFAINRWSRWNISLRIKVFSIGVRLRDERWTAARRTVKSKGNKNPFGINQSELLTAFGWLCSTVLSHNDLDLVCCSRHLIQTPNSFGGHPALLLLFLLFSLYINRVNFVNKKLSRKFIQSQSVRYNFIRRCSHFCGGRSKDELIIFLQIFLSIELKTFRSSLLRAERDLLNLKDSSYIYYGARGKKRKNLNQ
jgi:hypothetical protein